jgi:hypothetical protein
MEDEFLYLEDGVIKVSEMTMEIPEFKDFKRYDTSTNKVFFYKSMAYIYYTYKVFGTNRSYLHNLPLPQRRLQTVKHHTGSYKKVSDFEDNKWVKECIEAYLKYSRTANENMFDTLKDDIEMFVELINKTPHVIKQKVTIYRKLDKDDKFETPIEVEIEIPNTEKRLSLLKQASDINELFQKKYKDVQKDQEKKRRSGVTMFEDKEVLKDIPLTEIPKAAR